MGSGVQCDVDAVHLTGHLHIGEQHIEELWPYQAKGGGVAAGGFFDVEAFISEHLRCHYADQGLVFNEQDA
jgi:hypothetical protein